MEGCKLCNLSYVPTHLKTQQTPKVDAQVPLAVPPFRLHSLALGRGGVGIIDVKCLDRVLVVY